MAPRKKPSIAQKASELGRLTTGYKVTKAHDPGAGADAAWGPKRPSKKLVPAEKINEIVSEFLANPTPENRDALMKKAGASRSTFYSWVAEFKGQGSFVRRPRSGRRPKLSEEEREEAAQNYVFGLRSLDKVDHRWRGKQGIAPTEEPNYASPEVPEMPPQAPFDVCQALSSKDGRNVLFFSRILVHVREQPAFEIHLLLDAKKHVVAGEAVKIGTNSFMFLMKHLAKDYKPVGDVGAIICLPVHGAGIAHDLPWSCTSILRFGLKMMLVAGPEIDALDPVWLLWEAHLGPEIIAALSRVPEAVRLQRAQSLLPPRIAALSDTCIQRAVDAAFAAQRE